MAPDIDRMLLDITGGSPVLNRNWFAGSDQWFFKGMPGSPAPLPTSTNRPRSQIPSKTRAVSAPRTDSESRKWRRCACSHSVTVVRFTLAFHSTIDT